MGKAKKNKMLKYSFMKKKASLSPYLPETKRMSRKSFRKLLDKHKHVMVKPVWGKGGEGIIQVSKLGNRKYALHYENKKKLIRGRRKTYRYIKRKIGSADYMVQKRISRPTIKKRPFDMRVIVQRRKKSSRWVVTGKVIKVAGKGYIVSNNRRSHGKLHRFKSGIRRSSIRHLSASKLESKINKVSILSAKRLKRLFPRQRIYGLDIATNRKGKISIIEANLFPSMSHFRKLKDRTMYRRIRSYKKG